MSEVFEKKKITSFPKETKLCMGKVRVIKSLGTPIRMSLRNQVDRFLSISYQNKL